MRKHYNRKIGMLGIILFFIWCVSGCSFVKQQKRPVQAAGVATMTPSPVLTEQPHVTEEPVKEAVIGKEEATVTVTPSLVPTPTPSVVTLCLTGDLMCLGGQQNAAALKDGGYDFSGSFGLIKDYLESCDFAIGNLETLISPGFPYTAQMKYVEEDCPNCNGPVAYLDAVKDAGFDVLFTCNNHSLDAGLMGIHETLQHLDDYGFLHTGTYPTSNQDMEVPERRFVILEKNGIKIGLVAFTELINLRESLPKAELEQVINCYSRSYADELIGEAKAAGADFIIAYNHWGSENTHDVREYQRTHAQAFAEAGADFVIGTHPHCLQESELLYTEDGRAVPCFYSLGNLVSSMLREINNDTVLVKLTLRRVGDAVVLENTDITACHVLSYYNGKPHVIVPVSYPVEKESHREELVAAEERILEVLHLEP